jgi:hypothetical protein
VDVDYGGDSEAEFGDFGGEGGVAGCGAHFVCLLFGFGFEFVVGTVCRVGHVSVDVGVSLI